MHPGGPRGGPRHVFWVLLKSTFGDGAHHLKRKILSTRLQILCCCLRDRMQDFFPILQRLIQQRSISAFLVDYNSAIPRLQPVVRVATSGKADLAKIPSSFSHSQKLDSNMMK